MFAPSARAKSNGHLYLQVAGALKQQIVGGVYPVGSQLPTEDVLCARFSVSRYTVREALRRLREDNLVASRQGAGTIVVPRVSTNSYAQDVVSINDLLAFANSARFAIESIGMVLIEKTLSSRTGLASGKEWLMVRGLQANGWRRISGLLDRILHKPGVCRAWADSCSATPAPYFR